MALCGETCSPEAVGRQILDCTDVLKECADVEAEPFLPDKCNVEHPVELLPGSAPQMGPIFRIAPNKLEELHKQLERTDSKRFTEPSSSPFGAPVLFVKKKDCTLRMCVDYKKLSNITIRNSYPLLRVDDLLDQLHGAKIFSSLDLRSGYHQVCITEVYDYKTAFRSQFAHFQFRVLPNGLCNAPATFQRLMNCVLRPYLNKFVLDYLDGVLIFSRSIDVHRGHPSTALELLRKQKLFIKHSKCEFGVNALKFWGHVISDKGITMDHDKLKAILEWPEPAGTPA